MRLDLALAPKPSPTLARIALCLVALGCSGSPRPAPRPPRPERPVDQPRAVDRPAPPRIDRGVVANPGEPLRLPIAGEAPGWLEAPLAGGPNRATYSAQTIATGTRSAVVKTRAGQYVAFNTAVGAVGLLSPPPQTAWIGFGARDELLAADDAGVLHVARGLDDWARRGQVAGAIGWDAAPGIIAATDGSTVVASTDGGKTWSRPFAPRRAVRQVLVRAPRTVVVEADGGATARIWISADGGARFRASRLRPLSLSRVGPWIWFDDSQCPAVLSADNRTWVEPTPARHRQASGTHSWRALLQTTEALEGYDRLPDFATPTYPRVPGPRDGRRIRGANPCPRRVSGAVGGAEGGVIGGLIGSQAAGECRGAECLRSDPTPAPPPTATGYYLLRDARCRLDRFGRCRKDRPLSRPPHTGLVDHERGTIGLGEVPAGCRPERIMSARGLGILLCRDGAATEIWARSRRGDWVREHRVDAAADTLWHLGVAADGTVLIHRACPWTARSCAATVRRPVEVGAAGAWYDVEQAGAIAHRPVAGGRLLTATLHDGGAVGLTLSAGPGESVRLTEPFDPKLQIWSLRIDERGQVRISGLEGRTRRAFLLAAGGEAVAIDPPPDRVEPRPMDPSHVP